MINKIKANLVEAQSEPVDQVTPQFRHIKELAVLKYEAEEKREQSLIKQSSQMQTAFAFMTAAIFMAMPLCIQYRGALSLKFFFVVISFITAFLIASLVCASLAQWRWETETFPDIMKMKASVINDANWDKFLKEYHCIDQWVTLVAAVQEGKAKLNKRRVGLIMASMTCFYCSIATIIISYIVGIIIIS